MNPPQNEDSYNNGDQLASVTDPDGAITSAVITSGTLPSWMTLNPTTGEITVNDASQLTGGTYTVDITTTDANGGTTTQTVEIVIEEDDEAIATVAPPVNINTHNNGDVLVSINDDNGPLVSATLTQAACLRGFPLTRSQTNHRYRCINITRRHIYLRNRNGRQSGGTTTLPIEITILPFDTDGDGIPDTVEIGPDSGNPVDSDMDGTPDFEDPTRITTAFPTVKSQARTS